jgi:hypothetical protein
MRELRPNATVPDAETGAAAEEAFEAVDRSACDARPVDEFVVVSHEALFVDAPVVGCDACGKPLSKDAASDGYGVPGRGVYLGAHGELESVPLCTSCASAIGMTALARWEIEEEEG